MTDENASEATPQIEPTVEALSRFIVERTNRTWSEKGQPYYLSNVAPDLKKLGADYKSVIFPDTLKNFVTNALNGRVSVIVHPIQHAKVGLVPAGVDFNFVNDRSPVSISTGISSLDLDKKLFEWARRTQSSHRATVNTKEALINFLSALKYLDPSEINEVKIPTSVLIKMIVSDED